MKKHLLFFVLFAVIIAFACDDEDNSNRAENDSTFILASAQSDTDTLDVTGESYTFSSPPVTVWWKMETIFLIGDSPFDLHLVNKSENNEKIVINYGGKTGPKNVVVGNFEIKKAGDYSATLYMVDGNRKMGSKDFSVSD